MNFEKPELKIQLFHTETFLEDNLSIGGGGNGSGSGSGEGGGGIIDDTNLGDIGHEILDNIFDLNP